MRRKRRTRKLIKNSWFVLLIVWDNHGQKMPQIHKVSHWAWWWFFKSMNYTVKHGAWLPKYSLFSQAELSQVAFLLVPTNSQSFSKRPLDWAALCHCPGHKQILHFYLFLIHTHSHISRGDTVSPRRPLMARPSCIVSQGKNDFEAKWRSLYAHESPWKPECKLRNSLLLKIPCSISACLLNR